MKNNNKRLINKFVNDENLFMWLMGGMYHPCFISDDTLERYGKRAGMNIEEYFSNEEILAMKQAAEKELKQLSNPETAKHIIQNEIDDYYTEEMQKHHEICQNNKEDLKRFSALLAHTRNIETTNEAQVLFKERMIERLSEIINRAEKKTKKPNPTPEIFEQAKKRRLKEIKQAIDELDFCLSLDNSFCQKIIYPKDDIYNDVYSGHTEVGFPTITRKRRRMFKRRGNENIDKKNKHGK